MSPLHPLSRTAKERIMNYKALALLCGSLIATTGWTADKDKTSKQESIGLGSGAVIGAAAGGPIGLILGAAFGGWLGDRFHNEKSARLAADERYEDTQGQNVALRNRLAGSELKVAQAESELDRERSTHRSELQQALAIEVFFRTEDSSLSGDTEERLAQLAQFIAPMDGTVIHLEGHADGRGDEKYNAELSAARAGAVRDALLRGGLAPERVVLHAEGESHSTATQGDVDGMAFERRVQMRIVDIDADINRVAQSD
jgi:outer membrane protein OmpA-like peptidoglycan-associated protein